MEQPQMQPRPQSSEVSFGEWFLTIFLTAIPLVGIVLLFVWAFGATTNPSKANWAKASLAWAAIVIVLYLLIFVVIIGIVSTTGSY
jgi:succinate dehydrogenase/fumarate reductase cytochrome b subunit